MRRHGNAVGTLAGALFGPVVAWAATAWLDTALTPDCAAQISQHLLYGITAAGGLIAGLVGYLLRERPERESGEGTEQ